MSNFSSAKQRQGHQESVTAPTRHIMKSILITLDLQAQTLHSQFLTSTCPLCAQWFIVNDCQRDTPTPSRYSLTQCQLTHPAFQAHSMVLEMLNGPLAVPSRYRPNHSNPLLLQAAASNYRLLDMSQETPLCSIDHLRLMMYQ